MLEPGVSFQQLYDEIHSRGMRLMVSVPDLGWGSVCGNLLDRSLDLIQGDLAVRGEQVDD